MPLQNVERTDTISQTSWDSGMITSLPPEELPEDAAALIENFEFDDIGNLRVRTSPAQILDTGTAGTITSVFVAKYSNGTTRVYYTKGTSLFRCLLDGSGNTDITGAFSFPNGNRWFWTMFDDFAIGIHGSSTERPVKIDNAGTVTTLNASAPFASHGVVWNSRLWLSGVGSNGNTVFGSAINDPEDWVTTGDAGTVSLGIDIGDGDRINALSVFRGNLIVYKVNKINTVSGISAPATIPANLRVDLYTDKIGCSHPASIQNVLDDQIFLGTGVGVVSLSLSPLGNIEGAILSNNITELGKIITTPTNAPSSVCSLNVTSRKQYWLSVTFTSGGENAIWVMDYADIAQRNERGFPKIRWCKFTKIEPSTSGSAGPISAMCPVAVDGTSLSYLLCGNHVTNNTTSIYQYEPTASATYVGNYSRRLITRAYHGGSPALRTLWHRMATTIAKISSTVAYDLNYYYDNYLTTKAGGYSFSETNALSINHRTRWRQFKKNDSGRKANLVQLEIIATTSTQAFIVKSINLEHTALNFRRASTSWVSD